jgi:hypothetical protein
MNWDAVSAHAIKPGAGRRFKMKTMNAQPDTFAQFVRVLSTALDDHNATGEDLAARVYLSRSQFDRVIAATACEPPAAFRRRVLLERAPPPPTGGPMVAEP